MEKITHNIESNQLLNLFLKWEKEKEKYFKKESANDSMWKKPKGDYNA